MIDQKKKKMATTRCAPNFKFQMISSSPAAAPATTAKHKRRSFEVLSEITACNNKTERVSSSAPGHLLGNKTKNVFYCKDLQNTEEPKMVTPVKKLSFANIPEPNENCQVDHRTSSGRKRKSKKGNKACSLERLDDLLLQVQSDSQLYQIYENNPNSILSHLTKHVRMSEETFRVKALLYTNSSYTLLSCCSRADTNDTNAILIFLPWQEYRNISQYFRLLWPYFETTTVYKQTHQRLVAAACAIPVDK